MSKTIFHAGTKVNFLRHKSRFNETLQCLRPLRMSFKQHPRAHSALCLLSLKPHLQPLSPSFSFPGHWHFSFFQPQGLCTSGLQFLEFSCFFSTFLPHGCLLLNHHVSAYLYNPTTPQYLPKHCKIFIYCLSPSPSLPPPGLYAS